jgi:ABC-type glutathione transport system ATPase component
LRQADHNTVLEEQGLKREVCTDGTRVKILEDITKWANDGSLASPRVFWLTGQAGSGKTTIAYTIAKRFEEDGNGKQCTVLGGNFLYSRQFQETQVRTRIVPTIAHQLAHKSKSYANALHIAEKFKAVNHDVSSQMRVFLLDLGSYPNPHATLKLDLNYPPTSLSSMLSTRSRVMEGQSFYASYS